MKDDKKIHLVMPMAGNGERFFNDGYVIPKPLIEIQNKPFFFWAVQSIVKFVDVLDITFVVLEQHIKDFRIDLKIKEYYPHAKIIIIPKVLAGAVLTCQKGVKDISNSMPILFNDCDHMFECKKFYEFCRIAKFNEMEGALLTFPSSEPAFSYLQYDSNKNVIRTVEKKIVSKDAICGAYYFKNRKVFEQAAQKYLTTCRYEEFYMSGLYNIIAECGGVIKGFQTDFHLTFGTPEEYRCALSSDKFSRVES